MGYAMGQASVCSGYFGDHKVCEAEAVKEIPAKHVEVFPSSPSPNSSGNTTTKTGTTTSTSTKTAFRTPSQMLKDLKAQEGKKIAQERWAKTKAEWEANLIADIEEGSVRRSRRLAQKLTDLASMSVRLHWRPSVRRRR